MALIIILKNNTVTDFSVDGCLLPGSGQINLTGIGADDILSDEDFETLVLAGDIDVNDGTNDLVGQAAIDYLNGLDSVPGTNVDQDGSPAASDIKTVNMVGATVTDDGNNIATINIDAQLPGVLLLGSPPQIYVTDPTRGDKNLSASSANFIFSTNSVNSDTWLQVSHVSDADSGFIMPFDGTIVHATAHCENTNNNSHGLDVWINVASLGTVGTLSGGTNAQFNNTVVNMDFVAGDRLRLRGAAAGTKIEDTVATLWVKWRA